MSDRCEPLEELRWKEGRHWIQLQGHDDILTVALWANPYWTWGGRQRDAADVYKSGFRYLAPAATPDTVRALVEALTEAASALQSACERDDLMTDDDAGTINKARAALARAKAEGLA
jgi:hypothetical protein